MTSKWRKVGGITAFVVGVTIAGGAFPLIMSYHAKHEQKHTESEENKRISPQGKIRGAYLNTGSKDVGTVQNYLREKEQERKAHSTTEPQDESIEDFLKRIEEK